MANEGDLRIYSKRIHVAITEQVYTTYENIQTNCNMIYFKNQGDDTVTLNGKRVLLPGASFWVSAQPGEYFDLIFTAKFAGIGVNPSLYVMWKNP